MILHKKFGVNPTMVQYACPICGKVFDGNEIALLGNKIKGEAEHQTVLGYQECSDCKERIAKGLIALVVAVNKVSTNSKVATLSLEDANRAGDILWISVKDFTSITGMEPNANMVFISKEACDKIKQMGREDKHD